MISRTFVCALLLLLASTHAQASCRDDLKEVKPRIENMKAVSKGRYELAETWWGRAQRAEPYSETECFNLLAKARKALVESLPEADSCIGSNAYLPQCRNGGPTYMAGSGAAPVQPVGPLGGGGGGTTFAPPGSPRAAAPPVSPR